MSTPQFSLPCLTVNRGLRCTTSGLETVGPRVELFNIFVEKFVEKQELRFVTFC